MKPYLIFLIISLSILLRTNAQSVDNRLSAINKIERFNTILPVEKLYLSFDKTYYSVGDTIWFKSFLLNADRTASTRTDKIYVELFNDSSKVVETEVIPLNNGLGYGEFVLNQNLNEGTYTIRAYSNWQQNFKTDYFFIKNFYVGIANEKTWLLDAHQKLVTEENKQFVAIDVKITNIKNEAAGLKDLELYVVKDGKRVSKSALQTTIDGRINTKIPLPESKTATNFALHIIDKKDPIRKSVLPILLEDVNQVDLQFMAEGGQLLQNFQNRIAFKAIGVDGLGKTITGQVVNTKNEVVASLKTVHKGMGSFMLYPQTNEVYTAIFTQGEREYKLPLPIAKPEGTTVRIDHISNADTLIIYIKASQAFRKDGYKLLAQAEELTIMNVPINLSGGFINLKLAKNNFPDGIVHFTLFSPQELPVNERQAFINNSRKINLSVSTHKFSYGLKDSVAIEITAVKEDGSPISAAFSVAVTDDGKVKQEENQDNIISYYLLQQGIKGNIEEAAWYLTAPDSFKKIALDHLLLTQAWVGYKWSDILSQEVPFPKFKAEKDNTITGKLTDMLKKPVSNVSVTLMSLGKNPFVADTISNNDGRFVFDHLPLVDSVAYMLKIRNAKGKTSAAKITVDEFVKAKDIAQKVMIKPWYVNTSSISLDYYKTVQQQVKQQEAKQQVLAGTTLKEVEIKGNKQAKEFRQNSAWDAYVFKKIGEEELKNIPRKSLMELLNEKIMGFNIGNTWPNGCSGGLARLRYHPFTNFLIGTSLISHVMIDKINTHMASCGIDDDYNEKGVSRTTAESAVFFTNQLLFNTLLAEDIKEITLYKGCAYYFLEITTRSGQGPWITLPNGTYTYKPLPLHVSKEFYSPKYNVSKSSTPDLRSTIFWDANVVTDENGRAKISFYTADRPGSYSIKIEGTDMNGRFGFKKTSLKVINKIESK